MSLPAWPAGTRIGGRGNGKATMLRAACQVAAVRGEHVHLAARDGTWCVTFHPRMGGSFLFTKLTRNSGRNLANRT